MNTFAIRSTTKAWAAIALAPLVFGCSREKAASETPTKTATGVPPSAPGSTPPGKGADAPGAALPAGLAAMSAGEVVAAVEVRFNARFEGANKRGASAFAQMLELWRESASSLVPRSLPGATGAEKSGQRLPPEMVEILRSGSNVDTLLKKGALPFVRGNEELFHVVSLYYSGALICMDSGREVPAMVGRRAKATPPSSLDFFSYFGLSAGIGEIGSGASQQRPVTEELTPITTAPNPIYRLLALEALGSALPRGVSQPAIEEGPESAVIEAARAHALRGYVNETDPFILDRALELLSSTPNLESQTIVKQIRERQAKLGHQEIVLKADQALDALDGRLKPKSPKP